MSGTPKTMDSSAVLEVVSAVGPVGAIAVLYLLIKPSKSDNAERQLVLLEQISANTSQTRDGVLKLLERGK